MNAVEAPSPLPPGLGVQVSNPEEEVPPLPEADAPVCLETQNMLKQKNWRTLLSGLLNIGDVKKC